MFFDQEVLLGRDMELSVEHVTVELFKYLIGFMRTSAESRFPSDGDDTRPFYQSSHKVMTV